MDPDYEQYGGTSSSSKSASQMSADEETTKKIRSVLSTQIAAEIDGLENDIYEVDKRLSETRLILDRLRAAMLISYYDRAEGRSAQPVSQNSQQPIHPTVKREVGKSIPLPVMPLTFTPGLNEESANAGTLTKPAMSNLTSHPPPQHHKAKHRVIVGNVSKYIPIDARQKHDQRIVCCTESGRSAGYAAKSYNLLSDSPAGVGTSTHKWMVYVRGPRERPDLTHIVNKVWFFLHPTYKPNDLVEISSAPFHLTRRGWGEFPVRVRLELEDARGRRVDIIHHLKLDRTYTGVQNLGAETHVDVEIERSLDPKLTAQSAPPSSISASTHIPRVVPANERCGEGDKNGMANDSDSNMELKALDSTIKHLSPKKPVTHHSVGCASDLSEGANSSNTEQREGSSNGLKRLVSNSDIENGVCDNRTVEHLPAKVKKEPHETTPKQTESLTEARITNRWPIMVNLPTHCVAERGVTKGSLSTSQGVERGVTKDSLSTSQGVERGVTKGSLSTSQGVESGVTKGSLSTSPRAESGVVDQGNGFKSSSTMKILSGTVTSSSQQNSVANQVPLELKFKVRSSPKGVGVPSNPEVNQLNTKAFKIHLNQIGKPKSGTSLLKNNLAGPGAGTNSLLKSQSASRISADSIHRSVAAKAVSLLRPPHPITQPNRPLQTDQNSSTLSVRTQLAYQTNSLKVVEIFSNNEKEKLVQKCSVSNIKLEPASLTRSLVGMGSTQPTAPTVLPMNKPGSSVESVADNVKSVSTWKSDGSMTTSNDPLLHKVQEYKGKAPVPYVKYKLQDGRIMLLRKHVHDKVMRLGCGRVPEIAAVLDNKKRPTTTRPTTTATIEQERVQTLTRMSSHIDQVDPMPPVELIPADMESLVTCLVRAYPLLSNADNSNSQLLPTCSVYRAWPQGKRRALEWQRAKYVERRLVEYTGDVQGKFCGMPPWTTKNIAVWCRRHLYTPCCPGDESLLTHEQPPESRDELMATARTLLQGGAGSVSRAADIEENVVDVTELMAQSRVPEVVPKRELPDLCVQPGRAEEFIKDVVGQVGVRLVPNDVCGGLKADLAASVLFKLYTRFMEDLIRKSHAVCARNMDAPQLCTTDIHSAIRSNDTLSFLNSIFIDEDLQNT